MKTYPYNKQGVEGRRLFKLLDLQFNPGVLDMSKQGKAFDTYDVLSVSQCRANKVRFLFPSNLTGIKRPQVCITSDVEMAWGDFAEGITVLDFTHGEELPLSYTQPIEDDTLKMMIDAGLYRDPKFEELMNKLMVDELFDAEADMVVTHLDVGEGRNVPVLMVEPVNVVYNEHDPTERTNIADLLKRSSRLAIELRKEGVSIDDVATPNTPELDREVFIPNSFRDVITEREEASVDYHAAPVSEFVEASELLDQEIDVTEKLKGSLGFDYTDEDDRIRNLKDREWSAEREEADESFDPIEPDEPTDVSESFGQDFQDISDMNVEDLDDEDDYPIEPDEDADELER